MGYETRYNLKWDGRYDEISDEIKLRQEADGEFMYGVDEEGRCTDCCKWYDAEKEVRTFSKIYPTVLFTLSGEGEESGDIWKRYIKNGKCQYAEAKMVFDVFDESKLR